MQPWILNSALLMVWWGLIWLICNNMHEEQSQVWMDCQLGESPWEKRAHCILCEGIVRGQMIKKLHPHLHLNILNYLGISFKCQNMIKYNADFFVKKFSTRLKFLTHLDLHWSGISTIFSLLRLFLMPSSTLQAIRCNVPLQSFLHQPYSDSKLKKCCPKNLIYNLCFSP